MGAATQQLLTLVGVLVGASATFTASSLTERAKWRRSQDTRWDDKRLAAYSDYANALKSYIALAHRISAARGYPATIQPIDIDEGLRLLAAADTERSVKWETVVLLGSPAAVSAARRWQKAGWELGNVAQGHGTGHQEYRQHYQSMSQCRNDFYTCARADLGIRSGDLQPGDQLWLPADTPEPPAPDIP
ncbi:hypothetical protein LTV02_06585 [Nocardia yamanashiensis]|uniref:hypothetical protein n=1 Tax=Nocardia yamanashiensis TaxID=209247 RepID=UPI001E5AC70C|nr:hypothetical protein [Nocardia yamanashiensis]UGT43055.1 hypothetical protein LTV02_06585 [Nocardia yamanashiensis]